MKETEQPKIIVLGIDGLEYNLAKKWRLKNMMQKKYSKLDLSDYKIVVTPPIWGSMITGKIDKEIMNLWIKYGKLIGDNEKLEEKKWAEVLKKVIPKKIGTWIWDNLFTPTLGGDPFDTTANFVKDKKYTTVFDFFERPWDNGIPSYGRNVSAPEQRKLTEKAIEGDKKPYRKYILKQYTEDKLKLLNALGEKKYDFIFWYTPILDNIGHMDIGRPLTHMMKHYLEVNNFVGIIKEICPKSIIYIISDHGMEAMNNKKTSWGNHSDHAFFSSNNGETIDKPFQLYDLIIKHKSVKK